MKATIGMVLSWLWFLLLIWALNIGHKADLAQPIVCNANEEPQITKEDNYGTVTKLTCWRAHFNGPEVTVLFVD